MGANGNQGSKWIRTDKRLAIYLRDAFHCAYCGRDLHGAKAEEMGLDHLDAIHAAGHHGADNLVLACRSCNSSRGDRALADFAPGGAIDRIAVLTATDLRPFLALAKDILGGAIDRDFGVRASRAVRA